MAPTYTTDIPNFIPTVVSASLYDAMSENPFGLSAEASTYDDLDGKPGSAFSIPTLALTTPASDLAENVAAVDDKLTSGGVTVTIKEGVKSVAYSDRTKFQSTVDVSQIAGQRVGNAMNELVELDLAAAAVTGRNVAADTTAVTLTLATIRALKAKIPVRLRRKGVTIFADLDILEQLYADATVLNAAAFGSDEAIREGDFGRPIFGVRFRETEPATFPVITAAKVTILAVANGMLVRAWQKSPGTEIERDARGRLTRVVGTALHGEGVVESAGVVAGIIG